MPNQNHYLKSIPLITQNRRTCAHSMPTVTSFIELYFEVEALNLIILQKRTEAVITTVHTKIGVSITPPPHPQI